MRRHGERSLILTVLTQGHGKVVGFVKNCLTKKNLSTYQLGNLVELEAWARVDENMLLLKVELLAPTAVNFIADGRKLQVLSSLCSLCNTCMPELQAPDSLYQHIERFFNLIDEDNWLASYCYFEFYLLDFLGVGLDLSECAVTGATNNLAYVSPKTGRAVCAEAGEPYKERLYKFPQFILSRNYAPSPQEIRNLLDLTGFFLYKNFFAVHGLKFPECRDSLASIVI